MGQILDLIVFRPPDSEYKWNFLNTCTKWHIIPRSRTVNGKIISDKLYGYLIDANSPITVLYSHANAEDIFLIYKNLQQKSIYWGVNIFVYEYTGYGNHKNYRPSEQTLCDDIYSAYLYLKNNLRISNNKIILMGRSLGSVPTCDLASRHNFRSIILQSPLHSIKKYSSLSFFAGDPYNNAIRIKKINSRIYFIHGSKDEVIPLSHSIDLCKASKYGNLKILSNGKHNNLERFNSDGYIKLFIKDVCEDIHLFSLPKHSKSYDYVNFHPKEQKTSTPVFTTPLRQNSAHFLNQFNNLKHSDSSTTLSDPYFSTKPKDEIDQHNNFICKPDIIKESSKAKSSTFCSLLPMESQDTTILSYSTANSNSFNHLDNLSMEISNLENNLSETFFKLEVSSSDEFNPSTEEDQKPVIFKKDSTCLLQQFKPCLFASKDDLAIENITSSNILNFCKNKDISNRKYSTNYLDLNNELASLSIPEECSQSYSKIALTIDHTLIEPDLYSLSSISCENTQKCKIDTHETSSPRSKIPSKSPSTEENVILSPIVPKLQLNSYPSINSFIDAHSSPPFHDEFLASEKRFTYNERKKQLSQINDNSETPHLNTQLLTTTSFTPSVEFGFDPNDDFCKSSSLLTEFSEINEAATICFEKLSWSENTILCPVNETSLREKNAAVIH